MTGFAFYALGTPGPQGSKTKTRFGGMRESSAKVLPWREAVKAAAPPHTAPLDGPLIARIVFTVKRPTGAKKTMVAPATRPDLDKYLRATFDALTETGLWHDDSQVCDFERLAKVWWGYDDEALPVPGVVIAVCPLADGDRHWQLHRATHGAVKVAVAHIRGEASA